jgi:hypothetical protein
MEASKYRASKAGCLYSFFEIILMDMTIGDTLKFQGPKRRKKKTKGIQLNSICGTKLVELRKKNFTKIQE